MNRALAAGALTIALLGTRAIAADMGIFKTAAPKEPPFVVYNWTGFYAGIEGGMGWGPVRQTDTTGFFSGTYQDTGGLVGGTLGVNAQFGAAVLGLEGDYSYSWVHDMTIGTDPVSGNCGGLPARCESKLPWLGTFRGRVGYAMDNVMPYVTGGLSVTSLQGLERRTRSGGRDIIDHAPGAHDDLANSAAGALVGCEKAVPANFYRKIEYPPMCIV
jgi:outer membrane immunogenic protein